jgi:plasmid stabilization system protein ParE
MTRRVRWTSAAEQDALEIYLSIARENSVAAENVLKRIEKTLATLLTQPGIGTLQRRYGKGVRSFPVGS